MEWKKDANAIKFMISLIYAEENTMFNSWETGITQFKEKEFRSVKYEILSENSRLSNF